MMKYKDSGFFNAADDIGTQLKRTTRVILTKAAIMVTASAVAYAPYDTGILRDSITYKIHSDYATVGTNTEYAVYQEYGTSKMTGQPFLRPAFDHNVKNIVSVTRQEMMKIK